MDISVTLLNQFQSAALMKGREDGPIHLDGSRQVRLTGRREEEEKRTGAKITLISPQAAPQPAGGAWSMGGRGQRSG